ncbi:MAG: glycyl-radical enzyme activating protein [Gemmatimonadetes bacterium]|nr:glycyl-radical enzyme activating protein [Gemmatimonadota bacterium]
MSTDYDKTLEGRIFDIERYSTHDGPGIRTTLFLKGCYLSCEWCHNPESISPHPELMFDENKCIVDMGCSVACKQEALYFVDGEGERISPERVARFREHKEEIGGRVYDEEACLLCGSCVDVCYARALELVGRKISVADAFSELERDRAFYGNSGGGVTLSGGEPLYQHEFVENLLAVCHGSGLHTALDTTAYSRWEVIERALAHVDLVLLDMKQMDGEKHRKYTGVDNELILENAARIAEVMNERHGGNGAENEGMWIRMPVIPSLNDDEGNVRETARFVGERLTGAVKVVELLGYHRLGGAKFKRMGKEPTLAAIEPPSKEQLGGVREMWEEELAGSEIKISAR